MRETVFGFHKRKFKSLNEYKCRFFSYSALLLRVSHPFDERRFYCILRLENELQHSNNYNNRSSFIIKTGFEWLILFYFWYIFPLINILLMGGEIM